MNYWNNYIVYAQIFFFKHSSCIKVVLKGMQSFMLRQKGFSSTNILELLNIQQLLKKRCVKQEKTKKKQTAMVMASVSPLKLYMRRSSILYSQRSSSWPADNVMLLFSWVTKYRQKYSSEIQLTVEFSHLKVRHLVQHLVQPALFLSLL